MDRVSMVNRIGVKYLTSNIEGGEFSYAQKAGGLDKLTKKLGRKPKHFKLDIRFENNDVVVLVETKQNFVDSDADQLREYLEEEKALFFGKKIICILANTNNDKIRVWKSEIKYNSDGSCFIDNSHKYSVDGYVPDWQFMEDYIKALPYGDRLNG